MEEKKIPYKIYLEESEMPKAWYNLRADMINKPAPLLNPHTLKPMTEEEAMQECSRCLRCDHYGCATLKGGRVNKW